MLIFSARVVSENVYGTGAYSYQTLTPGASAKFFEVL
jgi:hypothetical protein